MKIYLITCCLFCIVFSAKSQNLASDSITINMRLEPQRSIMLGYHDDYLVYQHLVFSNPSLKDTVITQKVKSAHLLEFKFRLFHEGLQKSFFYQFYAKNGDNIELALEKWELKNLSKNQLLFVSDFLDIDDSIFKVRPKQPDLSAELLANKILWEANIKKTDSFLLVKQINDSIARLWKEAVTGFYYTIQSQLRYNPQELYLATLVKEFRSLMLKPTSINSTFFSAMIHSVASYDEHKNSIKFSLKPFIEALIKMNTEKRFRIGTAFMALHHFPEKNTKVYLESYALFKKALSDSTFQKQPYAEKIDPVQVIDKTTIKLVTPNNEALSLEALFKSNKGKVMVIDFWASWCEPCITEFPALEKMKVKMANKKIVFIGIGLDKDQKEKDWKDILKKFKIKDKNQFRAINQSADLISKLYRINSIPRYLIFNEKGTLINENFLRPSDQNFEEQLLSKLAK